MGALVDRTHKQLSDEDIARIARTCHAWRGEPGGNARNDTKNARVHSERTPGSDGEPGTFGYADVPGFCAGVSTELIAEHGYVLTPGRYVGTADAEDDGEPFDEKMKRLTAQLAKQQAESARLDKVIVQSLRELGYWQDAP